jgi:predicted dehydrogenase
MTSATILHHYGCEDAFDTSGLWKCAPLAHFGFESVPRARQKTALAGMALRRHNPQEVSGRDYKIRTQRCGMAGIGLVGIGFMGMIHFHAAQRAAGGKVVALCTRDPAKRKGDWTGIQGNFGPRGTHVDLSDVVAYESFEELLADPNITLVDLCVPNDQHSSYATRALEAGKDVLVEKPIALSVLDADRMISAAQAAGRKLMVAHVLPFFPEFAHALDAVRSGRYGSVLAAHFTRVISKPDWSAAIGDAARSGGPAVDLHIHDAHFVALLCGNPSSVRSTGVVEDGAVTHLSTQYLFDRPGAPAVSAVSGALVQKGRPFSHGFEIYLEGATLSLGSAHPRAAGPQSSYCVITPDGVEHPELGSADPIDAFAREIEAALGCNNAEALSSQLARTALALCWAEIESVKTGKMVNLE